jgi:hypothetical protein
VNKPTRERYNSFDEFWPEFVERMRLDHEKKTSGAIIKLLHRQAGFIPTEGQVNQIYLQLRELPNSNVLDFSIFVAAQTRKLPSRIVTAVAERVWMKYHSVAEFPDTDHPTWVDVRDWMSARFARAFAEKQDLAYVARAIFANLLRLRERDFYASSLLLFAAQIGGRTRRKSDSGENEIETALAELLSKKQPSRKQAVLIARSVQSMRDTVDMAVDQRRQAMSKVESLQQEIFKLQSEIREKKDQLKEQSESIETLRTQLSVAQDELRTAQGQVTGTEEHWSVVSKQQLAGVVSKLRNEIEHETKEIILSLDRGTPNTDMALQRSRRIEKILEKSKSTL